MRDTEKMLERHFKSEIKTGIDEFGFTFIQDLLDENVSIQYQFTENNSNQMIDAAWDSIVSTGDPAKWVNEIIKDLGAL